MHRIFAFLICLWCSVSLAQDVAPMPEKKVIQTSIFFGGGSWYIDEEQAQELANLLESIDDLENYQISIFSHTDNIGGRQFNEWLSRMRSGAVLQRLTEHSIPEEYIQVKDFGQENPWFDNKKWEGRQLNRRVDVVFSPIIF